MSRIIARKPGILDGMILLVGVAIGAAMTRLYLVNNYDSFFNGLEKTPSNVVYVRWILGEVADFACLWLTALTPIALFIRLRRPRPRLVRLLRQPGATALFAVTTIVVVGSILTAISVALEGSGPWFYYYQQYLIRLFPYAGASVAVAWSLQILGRRWRPERGAIDRFGRLLGICWIAMFLSGTLAMLQLGAWSAQQKSEIDALFEATDEQRKAEKVERETRRKESHEKILEIQKKTRSRLQSLIDSDDQQQLKAELQRQVESVDESIHEEIEELKSIVNPESKSQEAVGSPMVPDPFAPE